MVAGVVDKIGHDQKIARKIHVLYNLKLIIKPFPVRADDLFGKRTLFLFFLGKPFLEACPGGLDQHFIQALVSRRLK